MCLELIEEIEKERTKVKIKEKLQLKDVWPQLKYALSWMLENKIEGAMNLLSLIVCRRRKEIELEEKEKSEDEPKGICQKEQETASIFQKTEGVHDQEGTEPTQNMLETKVIENPNSNKEGNKYLMVATFQKEGKEVK
jgi:hypothetical protein